LQDKNHERLLEQDEITDAEIFVQNVLLPITSDAAFWLTVALAVPHPIYTYIYTYIHIYIYIYIYVYIYIYAYA